MKIVIISSLKIKRVKEDKRAREELIINKIKI